MGLIRDSFVIFKNWTEAIEALPEEYQLECYKAVAKYGLTGEIPEGISSVSKAMLISFSVGMENSIGRYNASVENGKKGGRPPKEKVTETQENLTEPNKTQQNLEKPNETQENLTEPTHNLNVNVNVNDNVNDIKLVNKIKKINCFEEYNITHACERVPQKSQEEREPYLHYYREFFDYCFSDEWRNVALEIIDTIIEAMEQAKDEQGLKFNGKTYNNNSFASMVSKIDCDHFRSIVTQLKFNSEIKHRPTYILGCVEKASTDKFNKTTKEEMDKLMLDLEN